MKILPVLFLTLTIFSLPVASLAHNEVVERPGADIKNVLPSKDKLSFEDFLKTAAIIKAKMKVKNQKKEKGK